MVIGKESLQRRKFGLLQQVRQKAHQAPAQGLLVQRRGLGHSLAAQHAAVDVPQKTRRQLHIHRGGNTAAALLRVRRQRHLQPLGNTVALHQHNFVFQRVQRIGAQPVDYQLTQVFQAIAVDDHQTGSEILGVRHGHSVCQVEGGKQCTRVPYPVAWGQRTEGSALFAGQGG